MTPEEEHDYQEAKRRIKEAEENKSVKLILGNLSYLTRFPPELATLTSLQALNLSWCSQLSDLSPLAKLSLGRASISMPKTHRLRQPSIRGSPSNERNPWLVWTQL